MVMEKLQDCNAMIQSEKQLTELGDLGMCHPEDVNMNRVASVNTLESVTTVGSQRNLTESHR